MTSAPNPYEPTTATARPIESPGKRSYVLTAIAGFLAMATLGLATFLLIETISVARRQGFDLAVQTGCIVIVVLVVFAMIWLRAAYFAWIGKRRRSLVITLVNFLVFAVFFVFLAA